LLDWERYVVGALAGQPRDEDWERLHKKAFRALRSTSKKIMYSKKEVNNRRGHFPTVAHGISFGGGQRRPGYLRQSSEQKERALEALMKKPEIQRLCGFASGIQKNYNYMKDTVDTIRSKLKLRREYDSKVGAFPARSFNLGKRTASLPHRDYTNLAHSWCTITALGCFNPKLGGHLVLWDFGLLVEFPPGSAILIPSALFLHSNTTIQEGKARHSIVQYAAGGLFCWVNNGCKTDKQLDEQTNDDEKLVGGGGAEQGPGRKELHKMFTHYREFLE
ncbi:hypothetical protein JOM56_014194, partial [Amanita muscaria]